MEEQNFLEKAWSKVMGGGPKESAPSKSASEKQREELLKGKHGADVRAEVPTEDIAKKIDEAKGEDAWREQQ